jgi:hypothetical protein
MRLAKDSLAQEEAEAANMSELESMTSDMDDDKTFAAMGIAKTIATVSPVSFSCHIWRTES